MVVEQLQILTRQAKLVDLRVLSNSDYGSRISSQFLCLETKWIITKSTHKTQIVRTQFVKK
jgi:hypothetical protein